MGRCHVPGVAGEVAEAPANLKELPRFAAVRRSRCRGTAEKAVEEPADEAAASGAISRSLAMLSTSSVAARSLIISWRAARDAQDDAARAAEFCKRTERMDDPTARASSANHPAASTPSRSLFTVVHAVAPGVLRRMAVINALPARRLSLSPIIYTCGWSAALELALLLASTCSRTEPEGHMHEHITAKTRSAPANAAAALP